MAFPVIGVVRPSVLVGVPNGKLSSSLLVTAPPRSSTLLHVANRSWRALRAASFMPFLPLSSSSITCIGR